MRWLLIIFLAFGLMMAAAVACEGEEKEEETPTASPTATAEASPLATPKATPKPTPAATPTAEATPAGDTGSFEGFRAFAQQIEMALERKDSSFFVEGARLTELTCTGEEFPLPCAGQPAGTTLSGIPSQAWQSDASALLDQEEYALWLEDYFTTALDDLSDNYGSGSLILYALAHSEAEGTEIFRAIATSIVDRYPTGTPIGQTEREAHVFNFEFEDGRWRFTGETVALTSVTSPDWLSGECAQCYDHWERWEGAAVASPTPEELACAAGSTQRFREVNADAPWTVYCPTFLPDGYELEEIVYGLDIYGADPEGGVGAMQAEFVNAETGGRITFIQGLPGLSGLTSGIRGGEALGDIPYGDYPAMLSRSSPEAPGAPFLAVLGGPEEITHWIEAIGPTEDETRQIAAEMRPVETLP